MDCKRTQRRMGEWMRPTCFPPSWWVLNRIGMMRSQSLRSATVLVFLLAAGIVGGTPVSAQSNIEGQDAHTVEVSYEVYAENKTPKEARADAIKHAQAEAVRRVVGTQVQAERRSSSVESGGEVVERFSQIVRTGASGRVVEYDVLEDERVERAETLFHRVKLRATVVAEQGQSDPGFDVEMTLNEADGIYLDRGQLEESQEVVVELTPTKDAYLTLLNVTPDTIQVVWPNARMKDAFVPADSSVQFPPPDLRRAGLRWRVKVPAGQETVTERVVAVATKQDLSFRPVPNWDVEGGRLKTVGASLNALNRWLVEIPLDQRALATRSYTVKKAAEDK